MTCRFINIKHIDGTIGKAHICGDFDDIKLCRVCGCFADKLCDFPIGNDKTCDSAMCSECAVKIKGDLDYCPEHAKEYGKILYIIRLEKEGSGT